MTERSTPKPALQARLREMIDGASLHVVSKQLGLSRTQLLQYLSDLPMNAAVLRGVEATLIEAGKSEAGDGGLCR